MPQNSKAMGSLRQDLVQCPITALAFYTHSASSGLHILAGEDAWLKVYDTKDSRLCGQLRVFAEQTIHGISVSEKDGSLLVWGAQSAAVVSRASVEGLIQGRREQDVQIPVETRAFDWIYDGCFSPYDEARGVLVTAHNEVVPFSIQESEDGGQKLVFERLVSPSRPILYSAAVSWTSSTCVLVAAGTVFGEIVMWKCHLAQRGDEDHPTPSAEVLFVFTGHEGSIFGVSISPEVEVIPGHKQRLLASCSDDRTIRIWDITETAVETESTSGQNGLSDQARETGFGENYNSEGLDADPSETSSAMCLAVAMGHVSRIWHVKFGCPAPASPGPIELYSFGEDTTMQRWQLGCGDSDTATKPAATTNKPYLYFLKNVEKTACHNGKHIWSAAVTSNGSGGTCVVTGGADGKVTLLGSREDISLSMNQADSRGYSVVLSLDDVQRSSPNLDTDGASRSWVPVTEIYDLAPARHTRPVKDGFLRYAFVSEDQLFVSTTTGQLLLGNFSGGLSWTEVETPHSIQRDLSSYNVLTAVSPGKVIVGSGSGQLYEFNPSYGTAMMKLPEKITDILSFPDRLRGELYLVTTLGSSQAKLVLTPATSTTTLDLPQGFIVTSVGLCGDLVLLGSRKGAVAVYKKTPDGDSYVHQTLRNDCKTKGGDAVTSITILPPLGRSKPKYFLTTCRDGKIRIYEIQQPSPSGGITLHLRHETTPPLGPMLEGARLIRSKQGDLELIIHGFRSTNFVVWNETKQQEIASIVCGGAHRTFDFFSHPTEADKIRFVYTKASAMGIMVQDRASLDIVRQGGHGREIRSVASNGKYIATGAEDTCIRIWEHTQGEDGTVTDMRCLAVLQKHTAGIQALKWHGEDYLLSSAGAEEFYVWKVTSLESEYKGLAVVCEAIYPDRTTDGDLRITDFDVSSLPSQDGKAGMLLTLAFSNSTLKTYRYSLEEGFALLHAGRYTGACLTQVRHLQPRGRGDMALLTAATDGYVSLWQTRGEEGEQERAYGLVVQKRVHSNSIKSLDIRSVRAGWQVITGGDDNALAVLALTLDPEKDTFALIQALRVKDAHAAAITGTCIVGADEQYVHVATVSNDQRLKIWRVEQSSSGRGRVALLHNKYSALADPGGLDMIAPGKLMVGGVGMEIWSLMPS